MKSPAFRTTLLSAAVFSTALALAPGRALAAEAAGDDDESGKPNASGMGKIKDAGTRQAKPEIAEASDEAAQALKRMKVPEGLKIDLWAAEPMLANPVAFNFDEKGRIFVAETYRYRSSVLDIRDYMWILEDDLASRTIEDRTAVIRRRFGAAGEKELSIEGEVVRLVEDSDGDGKADKSYVYADGFNSALDGIASGVLARRGKVWFTNIPSVWQFTGDKKAETRTELSRGYGVRFNYTGHDLHGLVWGPDGKIYFSNGDRGATVKTKEGTTLSVPDEGAVFRCNPDGSQLEIFAHGLRNPQSLIFTENGDLLTGDNDCDNGDEERLVHVVWGGDSGWRIGYQFAPLEKAGAWNTERLWHQRHPGQPAYLLAPIANIEDGPSGIEYYPGTGLNPSYKGSIFVTHFKGAIARSGIYTYKVKEKGASYEVADAKPFMTSALPTDVKFGPDGRLYTSDWADGWPKSKRGRIYAVSDPSQAGNPLIKETQALIGGDWTKRSHDELGKLLGHADWRVRLEAQYELAERGAPAFATLANTAGDKTANPLARRHAIWGIGQQAAKSAELLRPLRTLLKDSDSEVRAQALKVLGEHRSQQDAAAFIAALVDPNGRVKFFGAQGLARIKHPAAVPAVFAALKANADQDNYLRHALVMALVAADDRAALKAAAKDASAPVRLGALLALRRLKSPDVQLFLGDSDAYIAKEAAIAINDEPIAEAFPALAALLDKPVASEPVMLRAINAHFRLGQPANAAALARYAALADAPPALRAEAIAQLALWAKPPQRDRIVGVFRPLKPETRDRAIATGALQPLLAQLLDAASPAAVQTAALKALQDLEIAGATDALFATLQNEQAPGATRAAALNALDKIKDKRLPEAVRLASASSASQLRLAALPLAARLSPDAAAPVLANLIAKGTIEEQKAALRALGRLRHPTADQLLTEQLTRLAEGKVNGAVQLELLTAAGARSNPKIKELLAKREADLAASNDPLAPYRVALQGGNRQRGESLFRNHPVSCLRCHRAGGDGGDMGPNLADIGAKFPREYLLEAVLKPNATIAEGFDSVLLTLKDGSTVAGIVAHDTADTLSVRDADNKIVDVKKANIANRARGTSAMPEVYGLNEVMTKTQLRDIIEYLASLKSRPATLDADKPRALRGLPLAQAATGGHP